MAALAVKGEVVSADGQARAVPLKIVKASDVERGGGRKLMLSWKPEGLAPGRYVLKVAVTRGGREQRGVRGAVGAPLTPAPLAAG